MAETTHGPSKVVVYADSTIFSGAEALLGDVVDGLAADPRFDVDFCAPKENRDLTERLERATGRTAAAEVPTQSLPLAAFDLYDPRRIIAVRRALAEVKADVMLLNLPSAEYGSTPLLALPRDRYPVVGLMHISGTMGRMGFRLGRAREILARRAVRRLDSVCLLSDQARRDYPGNWSPRGTDLNVIRMPFPSVQPGDQAEARRVLGLPGEATLIGLAGRLTVKQKGHDTLIDAAAILLEDHPDLEFALAGEGQDRAMIESRLNERGLTDSFILLGQVDGIGQFLNAIDLIAIPSRFEGLPLIALEAHSAGVPGVASSVDGLCDAWPAEWRVEPDEPEQLAAALARLLDAGDPAQRDLVRSGRSLMKNLTSNDAAGDVASSLVRAIAGE